MSTLLTRASCFSLLLLLFFSLPPSLFAADVAAVTPADTKQQSRSSDLSGAIREDDDVNIRLYEYLKKRVRKYTRPVLHPSDRVDIHVSSALYQIVDLDQRNNLATISAYFDVWWIDPFLAWNTSDFDGVDCSFLPTDMMWKPEFHLYHSIQGATATFGGQSAVEVHSSGRVRMFVPLTSRALCPINVKYFPFDTQKCNFLRLHVALFTGWAYLSGRPI
uniref:Neurotransmitter-gated ion-channel ligand-binding domain-containing protein n=1 Tax=Plectus sambesii TaxID=2011161 RepID=A0A914X9F9_9BILA